jgi:hypothetical protein
MSRQVTVAVSKLKEIADLIEQAKLAVDDIKATSIHAPDKVTTISIAKFIRDMDTVIDRVFEQKETYIIQKSGKPLAAIIHSRELLYLYPQKLQME